MAAMMLDAVYVCLGCGKKYVASYFRSGGVRDMVDKHCTPDYCHECFAEIKRECGDK